MTAHVDSKYENLNGEEKERFRTEFFYVREKTLLCFGKLNLTYTLPNDLYERLDVSRLEDKTLSEDEFVDTETGM